MGPRSGCGRKEEPYHISFLRKRESSLAEEGGGWLRLAVGDHPYLVQPSGWSAGRRWWPVRAWAGILGFELRGVRGLESQSSPGTLSAASSGTGSPAVRRA